MHMSHFLNIHHKSSIICLTVLYKEAYKAWTSASSPEPLLPGCVPELQLDTDPRLHLQEVDVEVHPNRLVDGLQERVFGVTLQQGGLAHCGVPQHDDPELVLP